jgi:hypothetical protein
MVAWLSHLLHTTSIAEQYVSSVNEAYANMRLQPPANKPAGFWCLYHDGLLVVPKRGLRVRDVIPRTDYDRNV